MIARRPQKSHLLLLLAPYLFYFFFFLKVFIETWTSSSSSARLTMILLFWGGFLHRHGEDDPDLWCGRLARKHMSLIGKAWLWANTSLYKQHWLVICLQATHVQCLQVKWDPVWSVSNIISHDQTFLEWCNWLENSPCRKTEMTRRNNKRAHDAVSSRLFNAATFCVTFREFYLFRLEAIMWCKCNEHLLDCFFFMRRVIKSLYEC